MDPNEEKLREEIKKRKKDGWIDAWFGVEALAVSEETVKKSLELHIKKMSATHDILVYEAKFSAVEKVKNPLKQMKDVEEAYSQIVEVKLFIKDLLTLIKAIMMYGPSSVEIIEPKELKLKLEETQNIANVIATLIHQFAAAGIGGLVITPEK